MNLDYRDLYKSESVGSYGAFGLHVQVAVHLPTQEGQPAPVADLDHETIRHMTYDVEKLIKGTIMRVQIAKMPHAQERAKAEREELLGCFGQPIYVEEIPNGYCPDWCCAHLPWFIVTTSVGRVKIGWRKRVINLDWSETKGTKTANELFASEETTKGERYIHAWDSARAKVYVDAVLSGVPLQCPP